MTQIHGGFEKVIIRSKKGVVELSQCTSSIDVSQAISNAYSLGYSPLLAYRPQEITMNIQGLCHVDYLTNLAFVQNVEFELFFDGKRVWSGWGIITEFHHDYNYCPIAESAMVNFEIIPTDLFDEHGVNLMETQERYNVEDYI